MSEVPEVSNTPHGMTFELVNGELWVIIRFDNKRQVLAFIVEEDSPDLELSHENGFYISTELSSSCAPLSVHQKMVTMFSEMTPVDLLRRTDLIESYREAIIREQVLHAEVNTPGVPSNHEAECELEDVRKKLRRLEEQMNESEIAEAHERGS